VAHSRTIFLHRWGGSSARSDCSHSSTVVAGISLRNGAMLLILRPAIIKIALHDQHSSGCRMLHGSCATRRCSREADSLCDGCRSRGRGGWCCHTGARDREQMCHRLVDENTNSPRDMQCELRHAFGWTYRDSSWRACDPAAFLLPSQQQLLPSTFFPPCTTSRAVGTQNCVFCLRGTGLRRQLRSGGKLLEIGLVR
jgi:hypothetical protein